MKYIVNCLKTNGDVLKREFDFTALDDAKAFAMDEILALANAGESVTFKKEHEDSFRMKLYAYATDAYGYETGQDMTIEITLENGEVMPHLPNILNAL